MNIRLAIVTALVFGLGFVNLPAYAADSEAQAIAAEQAGKYREALSYYTQELQGVPDGSTKEQALREKIIDIAKKLRPAPAIPEEVVDLEGRAEAAARLATKPEDFRKAAREYQKIIRLAPWAGQYYFNLAVVLEKGKATKGAIGNYQLYLRALPDAQDAREVRKRIAGLTYELENPPSAVVSPEQNANQSGASSGATQAACDIGGIWVGNIGSSIERREYRKVPGGAETRILDIGGPFGWAFYRDLGGGKEFYWNANDPEYPLQVVVSLTSCDEMKATIDGRLTGHRVDIYKRVR